MKLYTENQMKDAIIESFLSTYPTNGDDILSKFTPIELPSDEKMEKILDSRSDEYASGYYCAISMIEDQIKQQNNA